MMYTGQSAYTKVGRLKPDETTDTIRILTDSEGEIGYITKQHATAVLCGIEPQPVPPVGSSDLSLTARGFKVNVPSDGQLYVAVAKQMWNLIDKWPHKKAALFIPEKWGIDFWESEFAVTEVRCNELIDINREWNDGDVYKQTVVITSGFMSGVKYRIISNYKNSYRIQIESEPDLCFDDWYIAPLPYAAANRIFSGGTVEGSGFFVTVNGNAPRGLYYRRSQPIDLRGYTKVYVPWKMKALPQYMGGKPGPIIYHGAGHLVTNTNTNTLVVSKNVEGTIYWTNPNYPAWDVIEAPFNGYYRENPYIPNIQIPDYAFPTYMDLEVGSFQYIRDCPSTGVVQFDKYRIYDPIAKEYALDDNALPILSSPYWRTSSGIGDSLATTAIQWYWNGIGDVYLTSNPLGFDPIMFDDEIRIDVQVGTDLRIRDYALGAERIVYEAYTVSQELVDITSLCRVGINTITITVRDSVGGKVGYPSPVYVKRKF